MLANLSAYDFGYIPVGQLIERTANTLRTMRSMERHRGHFYNWYDTLSLKPLHPAYVSTVDSGNLAGHLLTLRPGLLSLPDRPILQTRCFDGLRDTLGILVDAVGGVTPASLTQFQKDLESACDSRPSTLTAARLTLDRLAARAAEYADNIDADPVTDASWWARTLARQCQGALDELRLLAPWSLLPAATKSAQRLPRHRRNPHAARSGRTRGRTAIDHRTTSGRLDNTRTARMAE